MLSRQWSGNGRYGRLLPPGADGTEEMLELHPKDLHAHPGLPAPASSQACLWVNRGTSEAGSAAAVEGPAPAGLPHQGRLGLREPLVGGLNLRPTGRKPRVHGSSTSPVCTG